MGLNLSIKRVVFSALRKYDGKQTRDLTAQEIKQIGGRAGRYGHHENGIVAVLGEAGTPAHIRKMLAAPPEPITELRPLVQPDSDIVRAVAEEIETDSLYGVLVRIKRAVLRADDPNYRLADMDQAFEIASALEGVEGLSLTQRWVYAMCPIDERDNGIARLVGWASDHAAGRRVPPPGTGRLVQPPKRGAKSLSAPRSAISASSPGAGSRCALPTPIPTNRRQKTTRLPSMNGSRPYCASRAANESIKSAAGQARDPEANDREPRGREGNAPSAKETLNATQAPPETNTERETPRQQKSAGVGAADTGPPLKTQKEGVQVGG